MIDTSAVVATIFATWAVAISAAVISLMVAKSKKDGEGDNIKDLKKNFDDNVRALKESFDEMENRVTLTLDKQEQRVTTQLHNMNVRQDSFNKTEIQELKETLSNVKSKL